jgi:hypothetical protein
MLSTLARPTCVAACGQLTLICLKTAVGVLFRFCLRSNAMLLCCCLRRHLACALRVRETPAKAQAARRSVHNVYTKVMRSKLSQFSPLATALAACKQFGKHGQRRA